MECFRSHQKPKEVFIFKCLTFIWLINRFKFVFLNDLAFHWKGRRLSSMYVTPLTGELHGVSECERASRWTHAKTKNNTRWGGENFNQVKINWIQAQEPFDWKYRNWLLALKSGKLCYFNGRWMTGVGTVARFKLVKTCSIGPSPNSLLICTPFRSYKSRQRKACLRFCKVGRNLYCFKNLLPNIFLPTDVTFNALNLKITPIIQSNWDIKLG